MKRYFIETYGCQMNRHDSEILSGLLENMGLQPAQSPDGADLVLLNTCTVREKAAERIFGRAGQLARIKKRNPDALLGICGCLPQQRGMVERLLKRAPAVDLVMGPEQLPLLPKLVERFKAGEQPVIATGVDFKARRLTEEPLPRVRERGPGAWVTIMVGCRNFCAYCVVPYTRGPARSRQPDNIIREVRELADRGFVEITLLGQNVNAYGLDLDEPYGFVDLLVALDRIPGLERIRYTTSHPRDFSREIVEAVRDLPRVCEHFHLPVQAGSNRVLDLMNRGYTRQHYLELAQYIRDQVPDSSITTDLMVGFPGETEDDFQETLDLCRKVEFDGAFTFIYSPRKGTRAWHLENEVPLEEKKDRLNRLMETLHPIHLERNRRLEGRIVEVLVEGVSDKDPRVLTGRTRSNRILLFSGSDPTPRLVQVRVDQAGTWSLKGEQISEGAAND